MNIGEGIRKALAKITGKAIIDESAIKSMIKDIQRALILSDVNIELVYRLSKQIENRALNEKPPAGRSMSEHIHAIVYEELTKIMGEGRKLELKPQRIMVCGLFGSGKTTQIGKIAYYLKQRGMSVGVIAADMMRPAAYEQLEQLSKQVGCNFYGRKGAGVKARDVVKEGLETLKNDVIIIDTSGRDALDEELISELKEINEVAKPDEKILVISADIGQIAKKQAEEFNGAIGLTGVVITKMDGSGKGGGALTACAAAGVKIVFIGVGEKIADLEEFNPSKFVGRILGVPDFEALIEKVKAAIPEGMEEMPEEFNIETFYKQLKAAKNMGPLKGIFETLGMVNVPKEVLEQGEQKMEQYEAIINSMTKAERKNPDLVRKSQARIERISKGSGIPASTIKEFISQFGKMKKLYEQLQRNKGMQRNLQRMFKGKGLGF
ncbi:MAG: signal recognition particle receptor subunit alpha [Candidatus Micrarchaeota archaeon]|nr:signal recognition particle receptor subunit alpha [Candidatus Micrarchaeota archaeon]